MTLVSPRSPACPIAVLPSALSSSNPSPKKSLATCFRDKTSNLWGRQEKTWSDYKTGFITPNVWLCNLVYVNGVQFMGKLTPTGSIIHYIAAKNCTIWSHQQKNISVSLGIIVESINATLPHSMTPINPIQGPKWNFILVEREIESECKVFK